MIITNTTTNKIAKGCQHEFQLLAKPFPHATIDDKIDGGIDYKQKVMEAEQDVHHHRYMKPVIEVEYLRKSWSKLCQMQSDMD